MLLASMHPTFLALALGGAEVAAAFTGPSAWPHALGRGGVGGRAAVQMLTQASPPEKPNWEVCSLLSSAWLYWFICIHVYTHNTHSHIHAYSRTRILIKTHNPTIISNTDTSTYLLTESMSSRHKLSWMLSRRTKGIGASTVLSPVCKFVHLRRSQWASTYTY